MLFICISEMVVCKFFQQGHCRYGQNCRFEHVYGSKYTYHAPQHAAPAATTGVTDEQLVTQVISDVKAVLGGGQWLLSFYAPFKDRPAIPGFTDLSFEEARLFIYEAKANNNLEQAVAYINNIFKDARDKYERLLQPTPAIIKTLRALYNGEIVAPPFTPTQALGSAASVFRTAAQGNTDFGQNTAAATSIFRQKAQSVFGPASPDNSTSNVFCTTSPDPAKSIFAQAAQNAFTSPTNSNVFGLAPDAKSIFAQAANQNQSPFSSPQNNTNSTNIFASASQPFFGPPVQEMDPFGQKQNPFGQNTSPFQTAGSNKISEQNNDENGIYSKLEDLSPDDLEQFSNAEFKLGFIPELPPPRALCM